MTGHAFITHIDGWACSNNVFTDTESDVIVNNGHPVLKQKNTLKATGLFNGVGSIQVGQSVECVMVDETTGLQSAVSGIVRQAAILTIIDITEEITDYKSIIKKIK